MLAQFHNLLILVLFTVAVTTALIVQGLNGTVIMAVVLLNAGIGVLQEGKAEKTWQAIRHLLVQRAMVLRDGRASGLGAAELVPVDVVQLGSGIG